jgi:hypothetical protein
VIQSAKGAFIMETVFVLFKVDETIIIGYDGVYKTREKAETVADELNEIDKTLGLTEGEWQVHPTKLEE